MHRWNWGMERSAIGRIRTNSNIWRKNNLANFGTGPLVLVDCLVHQFIVICCTITAAINTSHRSNEVDRSDSWPWIVWRFINQSSKRWKGRNKTIISRLIRGTETNKTAPGRFLKSKLRAGILMILILYRPSIKERGSSHIVWQLVLRNQRFQFQQSLILPTIDFAWNTVYLHTHRQDFNSKFFRFLANKVKDIPIFWPALDSCTYTVEHRKSISFESIFGLRISDDTFLASS